MSFHCIRGLRWARVASRPPTIPFSRAVGAKAAGLRYERSLARGIYQAKHGQWWEYEDRDGPGWCQTDVILDQGGLVVVLEAKYTWTEVGDRQLSNLYLPVVSLALELPTVGVQVCKVLTTETPRGLVRATLADAIALARTGAKPCLHWLGANLVPLQLPPPEAHLASEGRAA